MSEDPDTGAAPDGPIGLEGAAWFAALKRTVKEFRDDKLTHWAGALTYYAVLSLFPALLAVVSLLGLIGERAIQPLLDNLTELAPGPAREIVIGALENVQGAGGAASVALVLGLVVAIWSASRYINGFIDAANAVWEVPEARPIWKKLPLRFGITLLMLVLVAITALAVVFTGPVAQQVGNLVGVGGTALDVWSIAKWPVLLLLVSFMIAVLYWLAPNVEQPGFRWVSPGSAVAVLTWIAVSLLFALYVANFGSYNETYGAFGGVAVFLIWLWLTNIAILFGAELNAELERGRQIRAGHPRDEEPYLPMRDRPE